MANEFLVRGGGKLVTGTTSAVVSDSPVEAYLLRLPSQRSRETMGNVLDSVARILLGKKDATHADAPWAQLQPAHIDGIVATLAARGLSPATINLHLAALRGVIKSMWRAGTIDVERERRLLDHKLRKNDRPVAGRALTVGEVDQLFAVTKGSARDTAILALAYGAGMRREEIAQARFDWLRDAGTLIRVIGKGDKVRDIPLSAENQGRLAPWCMTAPNAAPESPLLRRVSPGGTPTDSGLTANGLYSILLGIGKQAGIERFTPHDLRRSFITHLLDRNVDVVTVARLAGHDDVKTTMKYDRRPQGVARSAVELLSQR